MFGVTLMLFLTVITMSTFSVKTSNKKLFVQHISILLFALSIGLNSKISKSKDSIDCSISSPASFLWFSELSEDGGVDLESEDEISSSRSSLDRQGHRGNTTVHVCWHRNTSVSMVDFSVAVEV